MFSGIYDFKDVMSRDCFTNIRNCLKVYSSYSHDETVEDPLWYRPEIMEHFRRSFFALNIPKVVISGDDNTVRCKARTNARS